MPLYTVLIVDDDRKTREGLARFVKWQSFGFDKVHLAKDGEEAYQKHKKNKYDLIVSDIKMPKLDGISLLKMLREEDCTVPFIFLTAYTEVDFLKNAVRYSAYEYINKPIRLKEFKDTIHKVRKDLDFESQKKREEQELKTKVYQQRHALQNERFERILSQEDLLSSSGIRGATTNFYICVFSVLGNHDWVSIQTKLENVFQFDFLHVEKKDYNILLIESTQEKTPEYLRKKHRFFEKEFDTFIFLACYYYNSSGGTPFHIGLKQAVSLFYESYEKNDRFLYPKKTLTFGLAQEIQTEIFNEVDNGDLTIQKLSEKCGISVQHLIRVYKEEYGITPNQALIKIRIAKSKALLLYTNKRVQEVAYQCGFKDPNYFGKVFKKETGLTPREFREHYYA